MKDAIPVVSTQKRLRNYVVWRLHSLFSQLLGKDSSGQELLELGCGSSPWMSYFAAEYGVRVSGIDYSKPGCEVARQLLKEKGIEGQIHCIDLFGHEADALTEQYDLVYSSGLVEHFDDTAAIIQRASRFLKPGGKIITIVPNMRGVNGWIQKHINRPIFDIHVPLTDQDLRRAHQSAGLNVMQSRYFLPMNFGILNLNGLKSSGVIYFLKRVFLAVLVRLGFISWFIDMKLIHLPSSRTFSPLVVCVAEKPTGGAS